jgi:pantothenate synthetase
LGYFSALSLAIRRRPKFNIVAFTLTVLVAVAARVGRARLIDNFEWRAR